MIQSFDFIFDFRSDAAPSCVSEQLGRVYGKHVERILKHPRTLFSCQVIKILSLLMSTSNFSKDGPGTPSIVISGESDTIGFTMIAGVDMSIYLWNSLMKNVKYIDNQ